MRYINSELECYMDTGNHKEWITLYFNNRETKTTKGLRLTRRMAWHLMQEINTRLFDDGDINHNKIKEEAEDYCFAHKKEIIKKGRKETIYID